MKGYLKNPKATKEAFEHGWFHSGDLGVLHEDSCIELRDRSRTSSSRAARTSRRSKWKGVIIEHPAVANVAVVAKPDEKWGGTPCAFVVLKPGRPPRPGDRGPLPRQPRQLQMPALRGVPRPAHDFDRQVQKFVLREWAKAA
jgi:fatty-acyl-CoA synthase